jgi:hypothetical protein
MGSDARTSFSSAISAKNARKMDLRKSMRKGKPSSTPASKIAPGRMTPAGAPNRRFYLSGRARHRGMYRALIAVRRASR